MQFVPYLNFDGTCAEAFAFYKDLFKGQIVQSSTFADMPPHEGMPPLPPDAKKRLLHVHLQLGEQALMGSDAWPGADETCGGGYQKPQGISVAIQLTDMAEGRRVFDALAQGGRVTMPFDKTFWSPGFGMVTDRFGTPWLVNVAAV